MNCADLSHHFSERGLDHPAAHELGPHSERCSTGHANPYLIVAHIDQLDTTCVVFQERSEYFVDDSLHRFTHPESMRNCLGKRKRPPLSSTGSNLSYTPRVKMQVARTRLQVDVRRQQLRELGLELLVQMSGVVFSVVLHPVTP